MGANKFPSAELTIKGEIEVLKLEPGDVVIVHVPKEAVGEAFASLRNVLPDGVKVLFDPLGIRLEILRP